MKGIKKYLFIMAALAAVFGFAACSDDEEDNTVAVYTATETYDEGTVTYTATFSDDKTFSVSGSGQGMTMTIMTGTYVGDPSRDGTVTMTVKKIVDDDGKLEDASSYFPASVSVVIKDGKCKFDDWDFTRK